MWYKDMWSSRGRAGLALSQQAKGQTSSQKKLLSLAKFPLVDLIQNVICMYFPSKCEVCSTHMVQPTLQVPVYRCVKGEVCK